MNAKVLLAALAAAAAAALAVARFDRRSAARTPTSPAAPMRAGAEAPLGPETPAEVPRSAIDPARTPESARESADGVPAANPELDPLVDRQAWFDARKASYRDVDDGAILLARIRAEARVDELVKAVRDEYRASGRAILLEPGQEEPEPFLRPLPKTDYPILELGFSDVVDGQRIKGMVYVDASDHDELRHALDEMGVLIVIAKERGLTPTGF